MQVIKKYLFRVDVKISLRHPEATPAAAGQILTLSDLYKKMENNHVKRLQALIITICAK